MTRQQTIDNVKRYIRKYPHWLQMPDHRRMLNGLIRRARGYAEWLPFWPDNPNPNTQTESEE